MDIKGIQKRLKEEKVDGWLLYDFRGSNQPACQVLGLIGKHLTRRVFYWIPTVGTPCKVVHRIEEGALDGLPGEKRVYLEWQILHRLLGELLQGKKQIAMEYSPLAAIPYVSCVDGGTIDLVKRQGVEIVSSATFLQYWTCTWSKSQLESHRYAGKVLSETAEEAWRFTAQKLKMGEKITDYDLQQFILKNIQKRGCILTGTPIVAFSEDAADPHYTPSKDKARLLQDEDLVLIDLWCKKQEEAAVYADITRVAVASDKPSRRQQEIFHLVRQAQKAATEFVSERWHEKKTIRGYEVDQSCRKVLAEAGYGPYFTHRTGHNIHIDDHGPGANMDSLETWDERILIPNTCFSIEPGIYIPGEIGVRLEYDVFLHENGSIEINGGVQEELVSLRK